MSLSLLQRVQARLNNNQDSQDKEDDEAAPSDADENVDSESDIDDDISLDQCISVVEKKSQDPNSSFTRIVNLDGRSAKNSSTLKEVVSLRMEKQKVSEPIQFERNEPSSATTINTYPKQPLENKTTATTTTTTTTTTSEQYSYESEPDSQPPIEETAVRRKRKTTKLTDEEKLKREEEKLTKKRQQEEEKMAKRKKREVEKLEKELAKEKLKAEKKATTMNERSERKEECMDRMLSSTTIIMAGMCVLLIGWSFTILPYYSKLTNHGIKAKIVAIVDPSLVEGSNGASILKELQDIGVRYELKSLPIPSCIGWMKENAAYSVDGKTVSKNVTYEEESHILHKMTANELAYRVDNELNGENEENLTQLIIDMKKTFENKKLTILLTGLNAYYRLHKTKQNRQFRAQALGYDEHNGKKKRTKKKDGVVPTLSRDQMEGMLVQIQTLYDNVFFRKCEDTSKIGQFVTSFTRSIAEAPFKKESNASLQFCSIGSFDKASIKVLDDGAGILSLWNQQLQQFYGVRHETSVAITQHYPTPTVLSKAYEDESPTSGPFLLQDIEIRRGVGVLQTNRRVGPELSKRVHKLMTSLNGEEPLAK